MTNKELKILCWILALGQIAWIYDLYLAMRLIKIQKSTIEIQKRHINLLEK